MTPLQRALLIALSLGCCGLQPCPAQEAPPQVACQVTAPEGPLAPVLQLDCDLVGRRLGYTPEAHAQAHADVAALDAMVDTLTDQRERIRGELQALRLGCAHQLRAAGEQLGDCHLALEQVADPPSRLVWAGVGAGSVVVVGAIVTLLVME